MSKEVLPIPSALDFDDDYRAFLGAWFHATGISTADFARSIGCRPAELKLVLGNTNMPFSRCIAEKIISGLERVQPLADEARTHLIALSRTQNPSVLHYDDYRDFLRDWLDADKLNGPNQKEFAAVAGCQPAMITLVIKKQRDLSPTTARAFLEALNHFRKMRPEEDECFMLLFNKEWLEKKKNYALLKNVERQLEVLRSEPPKYYTLADDAYRIFSGWRLPVIFELAHARDFQPEPSWLAERLWPETTEAEAAEALETLIEIKLLVQEDGRLVPVSRTVVDKDFHTDFRKDPTQRRKALYYQHLEQLQLAAQALLSIDPKERHYATATISLGTQGYIEVLEAFDTFFQTALKCSEAREDDKRVYQLNSHMFPVSVYKQ